MEEQSKKSRSIGTSGKYCQPLLGHSNVSTTQIYTHVLNRGGSGVIIRPIGREHVIEWRLNRERYVCVLNPQP